MRTEHLGRVSVGAEIHNRATAFSFHLKIWTILFSLSNRHCSGARDEEYSPMLYGERDESERERARDLVCRWEEWESSMC